VTELLVEGPCLPERDSSDESPEKIDMMLTMHGYGSSELRLTARFRSMQDGNRLWPPDADWQVGTWPNLEAYEKFWSSL